MGVTSILILAMCCFTMVEAGPTQTNEKFRKSADVVGMSPNSIAFSARSRARCAEICLRESCEGFSLRKNKTSSGSYECVLSTDVNQLPLGKWKTFTPPGLGECLTKNAGGILVVLRTSDGENFERPWADYKAGFGNKNSNYWIGLDTLHSLTSTGNYGLKVKMTTWGPTCTTSWAYYDNINVGPESDNYRLSISGYDSSSSAGDSLISVSSDYRHDGMEFSTYDRDNDNYDSSSEGSTCAAQAKGAWWYNNCFSAKPTGVYLHGGVDDYTGLIWVTAPGYPDGYSFKEMSFSLIFKY